MLFWTPASFHSKAIGDCYFPMGKMADGSTPHILHAFMIRCSYKGNFTSIYIWKELRNGTYEHTGYRQQDRMNTTLIIWQIKPFIILACLEIGISSLSQSTDTPLNGCTNVRGMNSLFLTCSETITDHSRNTWTLGTAASRPTSMYIAIYSIKHSEGKWQKKCIFLK